MGKNVLYISYDGMTDPLGQSQVIPYLQGLSTYNYRFSIVSCEKKERFLHGKEKIEQILSKSKIKWFPIQYHKSPPVISTLYDYATILKKCKRLHAEEKFDLVHCRSYIPSLIGLYFKKKYNVPFIFDMRGFWADERVDGNLWNLKNPLYRLIYSYFKNKEAEFIKHADGIVSLTEAGKKVMETWDSFKKSDKPVHVIPCSADFNLFTLQKKQEKELARVDLGIPPNSFVLSYLGSVGTWYMLDEMLDFFNVLLKSYPSASFLFLSPDDPDYIRAVASKKNIPSDRIFVHYAQRAEVGKLMKASELSIFFIKPSFSKLSSSPTKLGELLAMGIPVICNDRIGDVEEIIKTTGGGWVIKEFNKRSYDNVVTQFDTVFIKSKEPIRIAASEYYSLEKAIEKYKNIYFEILK